MKTWDDKVNKYQAPTPNPAHDFKHAQCELKNMSEMMLTKEWSCNITKIISQSQYIALYASCSNKDKHVS